MTLMRRLKHLIKYCIMLGLASLLILALFTWFYLLPRLPDVNSLRDYHLQIPLRVMTQDGSLISEFGEQRRIPLTIEQVPQDYINALLSAEDENFYSHHGVDLKALLRAALRLVQTGQIQGGGSTITMQVARNYLLTLDRTFIRKFNEILLSFQIEQALQKEQILEMYFNKIFMGHRAYGVEAAAQVYYGRALQTLELPQLAMLAGLYKAPSKSNPLTNPVRAKIRRDWILGRMLKLGHIDQLTHESAVASPIIANYHSLRPEVEASYVAEMVRQELLKNFPLADVYTGGYRVYTTIDSQLQGDAQKALQHGLLSYDRRHGYRGPEQQLGSELGLAEAYKILDNMTTYGPLHPAIVWQLNKDNAELLMRNQNSVTVYFKDMDWARPYNNANSMGPRPKSISQVLQVGDVVRVRQARRNPKIWFMAQLPQAQGTLVAMHPDDGSLIALVGGFEYLQSKFNRATQALRQPGSNFKPIIYAAALEQGFTAASLINDAPVVFDDASLESTWRPENYSGQFFGPTRLRQALYKSRNLVSIRILRQIGINRALQYAGKLGFDTQKLPRNLSLALGSASMPPIDLATAYASFANGGYEVHPYFIKRIENNDGEIIYAATPNTVCPNCTYKPHAAIELGTSQTVPEELVLPMLKSSTTPYPIAQRNMDPRVNYILHTILQDVIRKGTGRKALQLKRAELAGKTGTTNDQKDAWFSGYARQLVATVWVGFDQPDTLGRNEFGSTVALPIWTDFMARALVDKPQIIRPRPDNLLTIRIDPTTGQRARPDDPNAITEIFRSELAPPPLSRSATEINVEEVSLEQIF
jgi:penicillin-binding protein 1A